MKKITKKKLLIAVGIGFGVLLCISVGVLGYYAFTRDEELREDRKETEDESEVEDEELEDMTEDSDDDEEDSPDETTSRRTSPAPAAEPTGCSDLTADELSTVSSWNNISNATHGYTFKYPSDWSIQTTQANRTTLSWVGGGSGEEASFDFLSGPAATVGFAEYTLISSGTLEIACETANTTLFSYDPNGRMYVASFNVDGTQHVILYSFGHINAGYDSNMIEQGELMMRTIEF